MASSLPPWLRKDPWTGIGKEALWGFSPAIDCLDVVAVDDLRGGEGEVVLFMTGASDCRHLLKTLSRARRHTEKPLHFIIHEPNLRTHARHLMFLQFLLELNETDDLDEKAFQFLELFGNCKLRIEMQTWLRCAAHKIAKFISHGEGALAACTDVTSMKSRERDWIEEQVGWWRSESVAFDLAKAWDTRMRLDLAERYDSRKNLIDWDYHMALVDLGPLVKFQEYRSFRNDAIAFDKDLIDPTKDAGKRSHYDCVNRSMLHFDRKGGAFFAGDIKNGPFACLGVETENKKIIIKQHDGYRFGSGICALHNVRAWLYEFLTGRQWAWQEHVFQWDQTEEKMAAIRARSAELNSMRRATPVPFRVSLCTLELETMVRRWARQGFKMDVAYIGVMTGTYFQPWLLDRITERGRVIVESAKFILELNDEQREAYMAKVQSLAADTNWAADVFGQRILHVSQLEEKADAAGSSETRRKRMRHPNASVFARPAACKTAEEMQQWEAAVAQQREKEAEELERLRQERAAAFEISEAQRVAQQALKRDQGAAQADAGSDAGAEAIKDANMESNGMSPESHPAAAVTNFDPEVPSESTLPPSKADASLAATTPLPSLSATERAIA